MLLLLTINSFKQRLSDKPLEIKSKAVIYIIDTLNQKWVKSLKPYIFHLFVKPESDIFDSTKNIMRD